MRRGEAVQSRHLRLIRAGHSDVAMGRSVVGANCPMETSRLGGWREIKARGFSSQPTGQSLSRGICIRPEGALPNGGDAPAVLKQGGDSGRIPLTVLSQFFRPKLCTGLRQLKVRAPGVGVPKAPVHEYDGIPLRKHEVRLARELLAMQPVPEASPPKLLPEAQLGASVLCPDT